MKSVLTIRFKIRLLVISLIAVLSVIYIVRSESHSEEEGEYEEEGEGTPGIMRAMDLWSEMRTYPFKTLPAQGYSRAFEFGKTLGRNSIQVNGSGMNTTTAPWTALGPKNFSGRILSLGFHPTNANIMWAGSASGGLWKTTTGGTGAPGGINWTYVETGYPVLGVPAIAVHPTDGNTIYIGTGEVYNNSAAAAGAAGAGHIRTYRGSYGIGILKSTNGGTTWDQVLDFSYSNMKGVADLVIDQANPSIVYAATSDGVYRTINAGATWSLVLNVPMAMDLIYKPGSSTVLYATCGNFATTGAGIYKCINADNTGAPTFNILSIGLPVVKSGKIQLAISPANTSKIYASIGADPNVTGDPEGLWVSTNEGSSWSQPGASNIIGNQGWYSHDVAADPTNANVLFWGELDLYRHASGGTSNFTKISNWSSWFTSAFAVGTTSEGSSNYVHADIHRIYATAANTVFMCTDGGIFKGIWNTGTGTIAYTALNGGLMTTQIYANVGISQQDEDFMVGGLQDNEGFVYEGSPNCRKVGGLGDGFHSSVDPTNDQICFTESYYLNAKKSTDKGVNWSSMSASAAVNLGNPPSETVCFNAPLVIAPSNSAIMYAGSCKFKKSTNNGGSWSNMNSNTVLSNASAPIIYIAVAPTNPNYVYVSVAPGGGARSKLYKTTNGGTSFTEITGSLPDRYYSYIAVDPTDVNRLAVTLSGFTPLPTESNIYLSHDGGSSWSNLGGTGVSALPEVPHNTVKFDPNDRGALYVGNDVGVFYVAGIPTSGTLTSTTGAIWAAYNEGIEDAVMVSDIVFTNTTPRIIRMTTYGRGLWERALAPADLPVVFKQFRATATTRGNQLEWVVASQVNVGRYEVEYSTDAVHFKRVTILPSKSGTGLISYNYLHEIKNEVNGYYRIKTVDLDESYKYSTVEEVRANKTQMNLIVYPNPTTGVFRIRVPARVDGEMSLKIYNTQGRLLMVQPVKQQGGEWPVDISRLAAGNYQVVCEDQKSRYVSSIMKR